MKNKKAAFFNSLFIWAFLAAIFILPFWFGGGFSASFKIGGLVNSIVSTAKQIPTFVWIIIGFFFLLNMIGGKKRR